MKTQNKETGKLGEDMAAKFLEAKGYKILDRNYSTKFGELDIIALDNNVLVFVEVKTKTSDQFGSPEEMITPHKLRQIRNTAQSYLLNLDKTPLPDSNRVSPLSKGGRFYHSPFIRGNEPYSAKRGQSPAGPGPAGQLLRIDAICINLETKSIKHYENIG